VIYFSSSFVSLVIAFIIRLKKGETQKIFNYGCPEDAKANIRIYYLFRDVVVSIAALSSAFLWNISPFTNFITAFIAV
jgi:hypothetical protein